MTVKYFSSDKVLEHFYLSISSGEPDAEERVHIPRSDVFYVRYKYYLDTGNWESLDRIERAMYLEGLLSKRDVHKPDTKRPWEKL